MLFQTSAMYAFKFQQDVMTVLHENDLMAQCARVAALEYIMEEEDKAHRNKKGTDGT